MKKMFWVILLSFGICSSSYAQSRSYASADAPRKNFTTIIYAGLGGAILGLSTLSFHGRPQDHMDDIAIGFAVGIIAGALYTSYLAATEPEEFYGYQPKPFDLFVKNDSLIPKSSGQTFFRYQFTF
ncbi:MAG: hypothetical protein KDD37_07120 [Bdellovibrionales bacterium]|nr:hypothetical protein [Bdellovibrionales bacterium]